MTTEIIEAGEYIYTFRRQEDAVRVLRMYRNYFAVAWDEPIWLMRFMLDSALDRGAHKVIYMASDPGNAAVAQHPLYMDAAQYAALCAMVADAPTIEEILQGAYNAAE